MKKTIFKSLAILIIILVTTIASYCISNNVTQIEMTGQAGEREIQSDSELEAYIQNIETDFSEDKEFIALFKKNVKTLNKLRNENLTKIFPDLTAGSAIPMWYYDSESGFKKAQGIMLEEVVAAYCVNHQDYQPCIDNYFSKLK